MMPGRRSSFAGLTLLAAALLGGAGCNTFSYFELDTKLDQLTFTNELSGMITVCHMKVSGATTDDFYIQKRCPPNPTPTQGRFDLGLIEYSTFADSGMVTFQLQLFRGFGERIEDKIGEGTISLAVSSGNTVMGNLKVTGMAPAMP
ncbi:MAG TPA: hypothetical protein VFH73_01665 [Polyangia bacterium]|jgi:hypothetical protein|nr:hypothetical protein [Polyangia bacterium]